MMKICKWWNKQSPIAKRHWIIGIIMAIILIIALGTSAYCLVKAEHTVCDLPSDDEYDDLDGSL